MSLDREARAREVLAALVCSENPTLHPDGVRDVIDNNKAGLWFGPARVIRAMLAFADAERTTLTTPAGEGEHSFGAHAGRWVEGGVVCWWNVNGDETSCEVQPVIMSDEVAQSFHTELTAALAATPSPQRCRWTAFSERLTQPEGAAEAGERASPPAGPTAASRNEMGKTAAEWDAAMREPYPSAPSGESSGAVGEARPQPEGAPDALVAALKAADDILEGYVIFLHHMPSDQLELHPYIPVVEEAYDKVHALLTAHQTKDRQDG